ncbi:MAG: hypothetical protein ACOCWR_08270 [Oceanidesulfovibrio sp.]
MRTMPFALLIACLMLAACAKPMTLSDFRFRCRFAEQNGGSFSDTSGCNFQMQENLCRDYANALAQDYLGRGECIQACRDVQQSYSLRAAPMGCLRYTQRTQTICEQYCRQNYQ